VALDIKNDWPLLVGGLLVVFAIMYALNSQGSSSNATVSYQTVGADPAITAEETSMYAAKQQTVQSIFSGLFGLEAVKANDATSQANTATEVAGETTLGADAEATALAQAADSEESQIIGSGNQLAAIQTEANDQLQAQQAQAHATQQNGFWNALFGGVTAIAKDFSGVPSLPNFGGSGSTMYDGYNVATTSGAGAYLDSVGADLSGG
jgi:hypothetical protein